MQFFTAEDILPVEAPVVLLTFLGDLGLAVRRLRFVSIGPVGAIASFGGQVLRFHGPQWNAAFRTCWPQKSEDMTREAKTTKYMATSAYDITVPFDSLLLTNISRD